MRSYVNDIDIRSCDKKDLGLKNKHPLTSVLRSMTQDKHFQNRNRSGIAKEALMLHTINPS